MMKNNGNSGIKISIETKDVKKATLEDTVFNSDYSSLMFIEKQTINFTAEAGETSPSGTETYFHNYGYPPLVLAYVQNYGNGIFFSVPYFYTNSYNQATWVDTTINMQVKTNNIDINWSVVEYLSGMTYPLSKDLNYRVILHLYAFKLGYLTA